MAPVDIVLSSKKKFAKIQAIVNYEYTINGVDETASSSFEVTATGNNQAEADNNSLDVIQHNIATIEEKIITEILTIYIKAWNETLPSGSAKVVLTSPAPNQLLITNTETNLYYPISFPITYPLKIPLVDLIFAVYKLVVSIVILKKYPDINNI